MECFIYVLAYVSYVVCVCYASKFVAREDSLGGVNLNGKKYLLDECLFRMHHTCCFVLCCYEFTMSMTMCYL